ncbi:Uncharacterized protein TCM_012585 [Theobroma cacao]|uniref:Uncharacterized protein n=1 Tax=Theobroma cacao TaxID=3641 RepID=A0A061FVX0_THECC|nr:Uncharacterized protein TCM_012585 [Theobroma cacao]
MARISDVKIFNRLGGLGQMPRPRHLRISGNKCLSGRLGVVMGSMGVPGRDSLWYIVSFIDAFTTIAHPREEKLNAEDYLNWEQLEPVYDEYDEEMEEIDVHHAQVGYASIILY